MKNSGVMRDRDGRTWLAFRQGEMHYGALVADFDVLEMPERAHELFQRYEEIVSKQEFSFLADIEKAIEAFGLYVIWSEDDQPVNVCDVQVAGGKVSFRILEAT
jgi:hypothetical protein